MCLYDLGLLPILPIGFMVEPQFHHLQHLQILHGPDICGDRSGNIAVPQNPSIC